ncbi:DUF2149 domain-containing protein [Colwellia sp. MSW7]|uniref:DUF2149 domain-containing protein n=1 Tax=Colwellia maritima TaxID=2912588 RepID=A0ABS9X7B0_9GAMM|nr:DUF2149 domain-containing protein [Colwellia maritima]MCI2286116.1 DUF2149 domain-containing protein [Colwellia maritima]
MNDAWRSSQFDSQEQEPLGPLANLIDIMLVFACGLIAALVALSPELEEHFQVSKEVNKQQSAAQIQPVNTVGKELSSAPKTLMNKLESQDGYQSMGQVYKDPKTGKLILISNE